MLNANLLKCEFIICFYYFINGIYYLREIVVVNTRNCQLSPENVISASEFLP